MADPSPGQKAHAANLRSMFTALTTEGFSDDQAVTLLCSLINREPPQPPLPSRSSQVAALLESAGKKTATRSPVDDRSADLWNPPAPPTPEGAPAP